MSERVAGVREIEEFLASLRTGEAETQRNLTVFPVFSDTAKDDGYTFLDDAMGTKKFRVTEISDGGHVPELKVINGLDADVLILDGEELVGAKQNRIVNTTLIIGRMREVVIPVSCVERGRWHYRTKAFTSGKANLYADLRKKKAKAVSTNLKMHSAYRSDQGEIWEDISEKAERLSVRAETDAMHDIYESYDRDLKAYEESFKPHPGQVGFIAAIDGKIIGCDIFGPKSVIPKVYAKLLRGYMLDALDRALVGDKASPPKKALTPEEAGRFLKKVAQCKKEEFKSVGEGHDVRLGSRSLNGFALVNNGEVIHVAAFAE